ncbi:hypothetical protein EC991_005178 [Linnemannia zychae]|nr:hypothetical protein EC991_005178 [Linnemannia zychae]
MIQRGRVKENGSSIETHADYYNLKDDHNGNHQTGSPNTSQGGWFSNPWTGPNGNVVTSSQNSSALFPSKKPNKPSWGDTVRILKAQWSAEALHHNVVRGDQVNIFSDEPGFTMTDDTEDPNATPNSFPSTSAGWGSTAPRRKNNAAKVPMHMDVDPSFFATATPGPADTILYHDSSTDPGTTSDRAFATRATTDGQTLSDIARRDRQSARVKVCGFHMHAMEWRKMQNIGKDDTIVLAERAQCPKFNLSVTRWLDKGFNHLEMEPFNTVKCYCGNAMIVAKDYSRNRYELVCRNRHDQSTLGPSLSQRYQKQPRSNSTSNSFSHIISNSCSMVIPIHKAKYSPLKEPVHREIRSDDWLSRFFQPPASTSSPGPGNQRSTASGTLVSALKKEDNVSFSHYSRARIIRLKTLTFKEPVSEIINLPVPPPVLMTSQEFGSDGWLTPKRLEGNETAQALEILLGEFDVDMSDEVFSRRMNEAGVFEFPSALVQMTVREGCEDADSYLRACEERMRADVKQNMGRQEQLDEHLEKTMARHANTVERIQTMEANGQLLPELKCRVCYERQIKFAILPCHHMVLCTECAQIVESCIVCRGPKLGTLRVDFG